MVTLKKGSSNHNPSSGDGQKDTRLLAEFVAASQPENEVEVMKKVLVVLEPLKISTRLCERIKTAVTEASMNAMEHGNRYAVDQPVQVKVIADPEKIQVFISDNGGAFDQPEVEIPDLDAKLAGLQSPRGWGMFLIKNMVDEMKITTTGELHTVELIFHRQ